MKYFVLIIGLLFYMNSMLSAQEQKGSAEFLPSSINFLPLRANFEEGRIGTQLFLDNGDLKVDFGATMDIFNFRFPIEKSNLSVGIEFMAFALATSYSDRRLQIDAADGFFGGHLTYSKNLVNGRALVRFRIIHNSAHLVDGHYDLSTSRWINNREPLPFTRDFGELTAARELKLQSWLLRFYSSIDYAAFIRPDEIQRYSFASGFELSSDKLINSFMSHPVNVFIAYHFVLLGTPVYTGNNNLMIGLKFGNWYKKGIVFYMSYYSGNNIFHEYFKNRMSRLSLGFYIDLF